MTNPTLNEFIEQVKDIGIPQNTWLKHNKLNIYVRSSYRYFTINGVAIFDTPRRKTFEIANISAKITGKKYFSTFLSLLMERLKETNYEILFIENVLTQRFANFFIRLGFTEYKTSIYFSYPKCFYKEIDHD